MKNRSAVTTLRYLDLPAGVREFVEFSAEESRVLATVNQKVAAGQSLAEVMDFVFGVTREICPCDRIGVAFLEDGDRLVSHYVRASYEPVLLSTGYAEALQGSSLHHVIASGQPRVIDDLRSYLSQHPTSASTALLVREGVRSSMTCPLSVDGHAVGVMFRSSRRPRAYDDHQVRLHLAIAERLSQAVEKAWRIERLTAANHAYTEMLGFVSHELKNPLASLVMDARTLSGGYLGPLDPRQIEVVERVARKSLYLLGLLRDYLDLARVESGELTASIVAGVDLISEVIEPAIEAVRSEVEEHGGRLRLDLPSGPIPIRCDADLLRIVLVNLLANAAKYGNPDGEIRASARRDPGLFTVSVWNEGPGFPESERPRLFRRFSRLQTPELLKRRGSGVGLYTCRRIIELHGGRIRATSEPGRWAEFAFTIPNPVEEGKG
ncbi:MAG: GAF domain-containing sensor histidine kinase [Acidobacteriia bacterium]|nr:GAF domain-containing sensor histidine kinase [Terriglobia bacterium]